MKLLIAIAMCLAAVTARASEKDIIPPEKVAELEAQIQTTVTKATGFHQLKNFAVDWSAESLKCLSVNPEMDNDGNLGVCVVNVSAFMVMGTVAIVSSSDGYSTSMVFLFVD